MRRLSALKWHGGKSYLAPKFVELMPPHTRYCEPYFGGGSVLFAKPCDGVAEFVNDIDGDLTVFWRVLQDPDQFEVFSKLCQSTPFSESEWNHAQFEMLASLDEDEIQTFIPRAWKFFILNRQSRQGLMEDYATPTKRLRRGMNENVSAWLSAVEGLPQVHARLNRVEIRCGEAIDFIKELDSPDTLFYCDPPYLHETRSAPDCYKHEMTEKQHRQLLGTLAMVDGKFMLSGYPSRLYEFYEDAANWRRVEFEIDNKASNSDVKDKKRECVWMNY